MDNFILKGNIIYSESKDKLSCHENSFLICKDGKSAGVFEKIPEEFSSFPVIDEGDRLIIPGMTDLHIHAPQYAFRGTGMDKELLSWLNEEAFVEEAKYYDLAYAEKSYDIFASGMKKSATTRACIFATLHRPATELLMEKMEDTGLVTYVGKVNMDREAPDDLREADSDESINETMQWLRETSDLFKHTRPILTPRFLPSCTDDLLDRLKYVRRKYDLPVQSHLSENPGEIELVKKLFPKSEFYGDGYDSFNLFGIDKDGSRFKTIMAHCVYSSKEEIELMKKNNVFIAHCPTSNTDLASGIAPVRKYIDEGMNIGLGSDVAGGHTESMFNSVKDAVEVSKLYWRLVDSSLKPLTFPEAFYMATAGGGSFFGNVGSFKEEYDFDAVILDDSIIPYPGELSLEKRIERAVYLNLDLLGIRGKYVEGRKII